MPFFGRMAGVIDALVATPIAAAEALATLPFYVTAYVTGAATTGQILSAAGAAAALVTAAPALGSVARLALEFFSKVGLWAAVRALASALKFLGPVCGFHLCFCMHVVTFFTPVDSGAWPHTAIAFDAAAHILAASQLAWSLGRLPGASRAVTHLALAAFGASTLAASATYHSSSAHLGFAAVACAWAAGVFALEGELGDEGLHSLTRARPLSADACCGRLRCTFCLGTRACLPHALHTPTAIAI